MDPLSMLSAGKAALDAMQQIQQLNEGKELQEKEEVEEDVIDPDQDPNLVKSEPGQKKSMNASLSIGIHFTIGSVNIGFTLHLTKEQGKENAPGVGLQAQDEKGQNMQGSLGELPEQDKQGSFTPEAWEKVQGNRQLCVETAQKGLQALTYAKSEKEKEL